MEYSVSDIARALDATLFGDGDMRVAGVSEPADARVDDLALALKPEYADGLKGGDARAAIVWEGADWRALGLVAAIVVPRPRYAMSGVTKLFDPGPGISPGVHATAVIDGSAKIGDGAAIGPFTVIGAGVEIGTGARIGAHVSIGGSTRIGASATILDGARIGAKVEIGAGFIAHPNAIIGGDGFAFVTPEASNVEEARGSLGTSETRRAQSWTRIHSLGTVVIGDDVEVGSATCIDRGTIRATRIGRGTKIDNLVQIGHNCEIGQDCLLCGQVGLAGSVQMGDRVVLGGQVGVSDNTRIGDDVVAGGATVILTNVPAGRAILGHPALRMDQQIEASKNIRRLPRLYRDVKELQKSVSMRDESD
ncbi:MAG: UDP-3-O-(3-hydroxymyristoyl)glucosamine N-acyltransferase [Pseudomonadota bacterium]